MAPSQLGAFARSDPSFATPNLEYHVQPLEPRPASASRCTPSRRSPPRSATCGPTSRGEVRLKIAPSPAPRPRSGRTIWRPTRTAGSRRTRSGSPAGSPPHPPSPASRPRSTGRAPSSRARPSWSAGRRRYRHDHLPPGRHLPDGAGRRRTGRGRRPPAGARARRPARRRRLDHADASPRATPTRR